MLLRTSCFFSLLVAGSVGAQTWTAGPTIPTAGNAPRAAGVAIRATAGLYLTGGTPLDPAGDAPVHKLVGGTTWSTVAPLEGGFLHHGAAVDGLGRVVVFGGEEAGGGAGDDFVWNEIDGNNGNIAERSEQAPSQRFAVAVDGAGRIYTIGGSAAGQPERAVPDGRVDRYDAGPDSWTTLAALPTPVTDAAACADGHGRILAFGGFDTAGVPTANVAAFDLALGTWSDSDVPDLPAARSGAAAVRGADGRVYVIGGWNGVERADVFVLDPATDTWSTGPSLTTARAHFGAVLEASGHILVAGGDTTNTSERLFTTTCPTVTGEPVDTAAWRGASAGIRVEVAGTAPFTFQWRKDGLALRDGTTASGSTIVGATTAELGLLGVSAADAGRYDCVVGNPCGSTTSRAATLTIEEPAALPATFEVRMLPGATPSAAHSIDAGNIVGEVSYTHPQYGRLSRPTLWSANGLGVTDLTPPNSAGGSAAKIRGDAIVGWWWWPYTTPRGTGYYRNASVWTNGGATHHQAQPSGQEIGAIGDTDGVHHVGGIRQNETATNGHAAYWPTTGRSVRSLTPSGAWGSTGSAIDAGRQFGSVHLGYGVVHAAMWRDTAASHVDMNPPGASRSSIHAAGDGLQLGSATLAGTAQSGVWSGTAASFLPLNAAGAASCSGQETEAGLIVGTANVGGAVHAAVWQTATGAWVDLHAFVPASISSSYAEDVDVDPATGMVTIVGYGYDGSLGRTRALVWMDPAKSGAVTRRGTATPVGIRFTPDGAGGYDVRRVAADWRDPGAGVELAAGGLLAEDALTSSQALGFVFPLPGGGVATSLVADDNGRILVDDPQASGDPTATIAEFLGGVPTLAPLWTDLSSARGSLRFVAGGAGGPASFTWTDVPQRDTDRRVSFQVVLAADGSFRFQYRDSHALAIEGGVPGTAVVVGCTPGGGAADPGAVDLSHAMVASGGVPTVYADWQPGGRDRLALQAGLAARSRLSLGAPLVLEVGGVTTAATSAWLLIGASNPALALAAIGMPGSTLYTSGEFGAVAAATAPPLATASLPIPNDPALAGVGPVWVQAVVMAPGESPTGFLTGDALALRLGY